MFVCLCAYMRWQELHCMSNHWFQGCNARLSFLLCWINWLVAALADSISGSKTVLQSSADSFQAEQTLQCSFSVPSHWWYKNARRIIIVRIQFWKEKKGKKAEKIDVVSIQGSAKSFILAKSFPELMYRYERKGNGNGKVLMMFTPLSFTGLVLSTLIETRTMCLSV